MKFAESREQTPSMPVTSPCILVCELEAETGLCVGCLRTQAEIATWGLADDRVKADILVAVEKRRREREEKAPDRAPENPR